MPLDRVTGRLALARAGQGGTGALQLTEMADISNLDLNVRDFGAKLDGQADDTDRVNDACREAAGNVQTRGGVATVTIPRGNCRTSAPIVLPQGVFLQLGPSSQVQPLAGFNGVALVTNILPNDAAVNQQVAGVLGGGGRLLADSGVMKGIHFEGLGQPSQVRDLVIAVQNQQSGLTLTSSGVGGGIPLCTGVRVDNVWSLGNNSVNPLIRYPLELLIAVGCVVTNFHGEHMLGGRASVLIDGTGYVNSGQHLLQGLHHEAASGVHGTYVVDVAAAIYNLIDMVYTTVADATDIGVRLQAGSFGNVCRSIRFGGGAGISIQDLNAQFPHTVQQTWVPLYVQDASGLTANDYGASYLPVVARNVRTPPQTSGNIAIDCRMGEFFTVGPIINAANISAPTSPHIGQPITITVIQDGVGGRATTFDAVFKVSWSDVGNAAGKRSSVAFYYDGANWNQRGAQSPWT